MNPRHRVFALGTLAALALVAPGCSRRGLSEADALQEPPPLEVDVTAVGRQPITESLQLNGSLIPFRFANLTAEVDGVIQNIPDGDTVHYRAEGRSAEQGVTLDIGHRVKKGDVLVELDPTDHQLALTAAKAKLALAENERDKLKIWRRPEERRQLELQLKEAEAQCKKCGDDLDRVTALREKNTVSQEEYDRVSLAADVAKVLRDRAKAAVDMAENGPMKEELAMADAQVALAKAEVKMREQNVAKCTIRAPYDAIVAERYVGVGDRVTALPRVEIMQIVDADILFAQVSVPERYQGRIQVGDTARVRVPGVTDRPREGVPAAKDFLDAVVGLVNGKIDPETRTFRVRVGVDNRSGLLKSGTFAQVEFNVKSAPEALVVPASAVTYAEGKPAVFVLQGDRVRRCPVVLGITSREGADATADRLEVLKGLAPGDRVVVGSATPMLADGMAVRPKGAGTAAQASAAGPPSQGAPRSVAAVAPEARP